MLYDRFGHRLDHYVIVELYAVMGIEVQSKMYIPGYYSLRDQNSNAGNGSGWSIHQQRNVFGEYRDFFSSRPVVDVNERNEKERLRQTILKHECLFRHQVYFYSFSFWI